MAQKQLSELTLDELKAREKGLKIVNILMIASIGVMLVCGIYLTIKRGFSIFTVLPFIFLMNLFITGGNLKKVRAEIAGRQ